MRHSIAPLVRHSIAPLVRHSSAMADTTVPQSITKTTIANQTLTIQSKAGVHTTIVHHSYKLIFDLGTLPSQLDDGATAAIPTVLISHGHLDHSSGVIQHASRRSLHSSPGIATYFTLDAPPLEAYFQAAMDMCGSALDVAVVGVEVNEPFDPHKASGKKSRHLEVVPLRATHRVPAVGYVVVEEKNVLRPDLKARLEEGSLEQSALGAMRKAGEAITLSVKAPTFAYSGDTTIDFLTDPDNVAAMDGLHLLAIECTYVGSGENTTPEKARARGHIHLDDIVAQWEADNPILHSLKGLILLHFSQSYSRSQIVSSVLSTLPPSLLAITHLALDGFD